MRTDDIDATIQAVETTARHRPQLTPAARLALDTLRKQRELMQKLPDAVPPPAQVVRGRLEAGKPALGFDDLHIDPETYRDFWQQLVELFADDGALTSEEAAELRAEGETPDRLMRLTGPWYDYGLDESISVRSDFTPEMIGVALKPWLLGAAEAVFPLLQVEGWEHAYCPVCGGQPDLAVIHRNGSRSLLCSRCDTLWNWLPTGCPLCGRPGVAAQYRETDSPGYLLLTCGECDRALKTIDESVLGPGSPPQAERLFAAHLDELASELNLTT